MHPRPLHVRLLLPAVALLVATGCSSADEAPVASAPSAAVASPTPDGAAPTTSGAPSTSTAPAASSAITIAEFAYDVPASVEAGSEVTVTNEDSEAHTVTLGGGGDVQVVVQGGQTVTFSAPEEAGTYPIGCDFHGDMSADLVVA